MQTFSESEPDATRTDSGKPFCTARREADTEKERKNYCLDLNINGMFAGAFARIEYVSFCDNKVRSLRS